MAHHKLFGFGWCECIVVVLVVLVTCMSVFIYIQCYEFLYLQHYHLPSAEGFFTPKTWLVHPPPPQKNDEVLNMLLYNEGIKIRNKTKCIPNVKMQWNPDLFTLKCCLCCIYIL